MKSFDNILVGIDYSESSRNALKQAAWIADGEGEGSQLVALHVIVPSEIEAYGRYYTVSTDAVLQAFRAEISQLAEKELGADARVRCETVIGVPYHELTTWAEEHDCDLLVLGSQGQSAHPHGVGFFAAKCVRHAKMPVLLTRRLHNRKFERVVALVDFSHATRAVLDAAASVAADEGAELHVVHAVSPPWMRPTHVLYNLQTSEDAAYKAQYSELLREEMEAVCKDLPVETQTHVLEHPNVSQALVEFLGEKNCGLAVLGRSGHTARAIKQAILGTTAERLIHRSPCSVLVIPEGTETTSS
jgi:nucleotide-binding universal stress UspA family protein